MTIAAHITVSDTRKSILKSFSYNILSLLALSHPGHHFIFIFDSPFDPAGLAAPNITPVLLGPPIKSRLLRHYWYNYKLPRTLNKYNADVFISSVAVCSLRTTVKQYLLLDDLAFLQKNNAYSSGDRRYLKKYLKNFIAKAGIVVTGNEYVSGVLRSLYPGAQHKFKVIRDDFGTTAAQMDEEEMQEIKERYSDGKEYFIAYITDASLENILVILKAFSAFKKRQLSNMQLLLLIASTQKEGLVKDFSSYKYRSEVKMIIPGDDAMETRLTACAYAALYMPAQEVMEGQGLLALKNSIPLITVNNGFNRALYGDAALYAAIDEKKIAAEMMLIYKDEHLKNSLFHQAEAVAATCSTAVGAAKLWEELTLSAVQTA